MDEPRACLVDQHGLMASEWVPITLGDVRPNAGRLEIPLPDSTQFFAIRKCFATAMRVEWGSWRMDFPFPDPVKMRPGGELVAHGFGLTTAA